jgi:hypothetical protein
MTGIVDYIRAKLYGPPYCKGSSDKLEGEPERPVLKNLD